MQDSLQINNGGVHSERLLDVGRSFKSIRILERRYNQPKQSINETDTEMAIVLITFPCHWVCLKNHLLAFKLCNSNYDRQCFINTLPIVFEISYENCKRWIAFYYCRYMPSWVCGYK